MERFTSRVNGEITAPKSKASSSAVPVIRQLQERLAMHRLRCGEPSEGRMFSTGNGTPLSLQNVVNRLILPALERQGRVHDWHGFHTAR